MLLQMALSNSLLWSSNIPLYICIDTTSSFIYLFIFHLFLLFAG